MAARLIQLDLADVRCVDGLVAALNEFFFDEGFEDAADDGSLGHPEDEPRSDQGRNRKEVELAAEAAMVALLGFFDLGDVRFQVLFVEEGGAVDARWSIWRSVRPSSKPLRLRVA